MKLQTQRLLTSHIGASAKLGRFNVLFKKCSLKLNDRSEVFFCWADREIYLMQQKHPSTFLSFEEKKLHEIVKPVLGLFERFDVSFDFFVQNSFLS